MSDEAGLPVEPENDPFGYSNAPELKHTTLSAKFMVINGVQYIFRSDPCLG